MDRKISPWVLYSLLLLPSVLGGCNSPYYADRGALFGGLTGAGVGALVGHASGHTGAGAAIGAGVGALTGAAVGSGLDEIDAKNRAQIEARLGRPVAAGSVSMEEVITMTHAGVADELIVNHIRTHGIAAPLQSGDLVALREQGVSTRVVKAMQVPPPMPATVVVHEAPPPVVVEGYWGPRYYWGHRYYHRW